MSSSEVPDLSWSAAPTRALLKLSLPITVSTMSWAVMNLVSTIFMASVGRDELAGVGLAGVVSFAILCFGIGMMRASKTLVAQAIGAGRRDRVDEFLAGALAVAVAYGALAVVVGLIVAPLLAGLSSTARAGEAAHTFLLARALAAPMVMAFAAIRETRYGEGDTRGAMVASVTANLVNIALDVVLIWGLEWGVAGVATAAFVANACELVLQAWPLRARLRRMRVRMAAVRAVWHQGLPNGLQFLLEVGSFLILTAVIAQMSATDAAAHQIVIHLINVSFLPAHALAEGVSILVGRAVGARRPELVAVLAVRALWLGGGYALICSAVFLVFGGLVTTGMSDGDPELAAAAMTLLRVAIVFLAADSANIIARGVLRGAGDVRYAAVVGVITAWAATPPLTLLLGVALGWGAVGGWIGLCLEIFVGAALFWRRVLRGTWRHAAAKTRAMVVEG